MDFNRGGGVIAQARLMTLNAYAFFSNQTETLYIFVTQTKAVYIVKTYEQLVHLFITMCAEKKRSVSQVIPTANRVLF